MIENYAKQKERSRVKTTDDGENKIVSEKRRDKDDALVWVEVGKTNKRHLNDLLTEAEEAKAKLKAMYQAELAPIEAKITDLKDMKADLFPEAKNAK